MLADETYSRKSYVVTSVCLREGRGGNSGLAQQHKLVFTSSYLLTQKETPNGGQIVLALTACVLQKVFNNIIDQRLKNKIAKKKIIQVGIRMEVYRAMYYFKYFLPDHQENLQPMYQLDLEHPLLQEDKLHTEFRRLGIAGSAMSTACSPQTCPSCSSR